MMISNGRPGNEVYVCADCLEAIVEGERYVEADYSCYHAQCLREKSFEELMELFGFEINSAGLYF